MEAGDKTRGLCGAMILLTLSSLGTAMFSTIIPQVHATQPSFSTQILLQGTQESESTIQVDPNNNSHLDIIGPIGTGGLYHSVRSLDGGGTWADGLINSSSLPGDPNGYFDPYFTFDASSNIYAGNYERTSSPFGIKLAKSMDGGSTWTTTSYAFLPTTSFLFSNGTSVNPCGNISYGRLYDFPKIVADTSPSSTFKNNVYWISRVAFSLNANTCNSGALYWAFQRSTDGGQTWTAPQAWDTGIANGASGTSIIAVNPAGKIYMVFSVIGSTLCPSGNGIVLLASTNGGTSFSANCIYSNSLFEGEQVVATSPRDSSKVYVIFGQGARFANEHLYAIRSNDGGSTWSSALRIDDVLSPNDTVQFPSHVSASVSPSERLDVLWFDFRHAPTNNFSVADMYYSSTNDFATFAANSRLTPNGPYLWCGSFPPPPVTHCGSGNDFNGIASVSTPGTSDGTLAYGAWMMWDNAGNTQLWFAKIAQPDFGISPSPAGLTIKKGTTGTSTLTLSSINGFSGTVTLSTTTSPVISHGPSASLSPASITLSSGGTGTSMLTVNTFPNTPKGAYSVTVTATSGFVTHLLTVGVSVT